MAISRLTLSASLVDIQRLQGPGEFDDGNFGGGDPHETLYNKKLNLLGQTIFKGIVIIDEASDIGGAPEGSIATDATIASINSLAGNSLDFVSDVGGPADPNNGFPFRVEINGFPIPNQYVKYVEMPGENNPGDRYYVIGVVKDGVDILSKFIDNGASADFPGASGNGQTHRFKVFYKFYDGTNYVWSARPIQIFHDRRNKPVLGNIVGKNKGTFAMPYSSLTPIANLTTDHSASLIPLQAGIRTGPNASNTSDLFSIAWHFPKLIKSVNGTHINAANDTQPFETYNPISGFPESNGENYNTQTYVGNIPYADYVVNYDNDGGPSWSMVSGSDGLPIGPFYFSQYGYSNWPNSVSLLDTANSPIGIGFGTGPEILGWTWPQSYSQTSGIGSYINSLGQFFDIGISEGEIVGLGNYVPQYNPEGPGSLNNNQFFDENWVKKQSEFVVIVATGASPNNSQNLFAPYNDGLDVNANEVTDNVWALAGFQSKITAMSSIYYSFSDADFAPGDPIQGCTDMLACNYNPAASIEDGTCDYPNFDLDFSEFGFGEIITLESGAGTTIITDTFFEIAYGNQADAAGDEYWPTNNPFYDATGQKHDVVASVQFTPNGGAPVTYQFNIQSNAAGTVFTAYDSAGNVDSNVTITLEGGTFSSGDIGGRIRISISNLSFNVPEGVANNQLQVYFAETTNLNNGAIIDGTAEEFETGCIVLDSVNVEVGSSEIQGCTDDTAFNFVPEATTGNPLSTSCIYCNTDATNVLTYANVAMGIPFLEYMGLGLSVGESYFGDLKVDLSFGEAAWYTSGTFKVIMFTAAGSLDFDAQLAAYLTAASTSSALPASVLHEITLEGVDVGPLSSGYTITVPGPDSGIPVNSSTDLAGYRSVIIPIDPDTGYHYHNTCLVEATTYFPGFVCDDNSIGITNYGGPAAAPLTVANNDLCISSTNCADYDVQGSVDFIQTDLYTGTDGETVACGGYFNISVSGPEGMMYAVKVSSNTGSFSNHYLSGQSVSGVDYIFNYIPNSPEGEFGATTITFTLAQLSELTGSPYAYGDYNFEFLFYLGTVFDPSLPISTVLTEGQSIINNPATTPCTVEYTYSLTEDNVQICGCTIQDAENYNPQATYNIVEMCGQIPGCTDPTALNYYNIATVEDGSCIYPIPVCIDPDAINYVNEVVYPQYADNTLCEFIVILGCTDPEANNFNPVASIDNGTCLYDGEDFDDEDIVDVGINDFENFLLYLQHCLQYKGEKYFSALLTGKTVDEDRYLHLSMINDLLSSKGTACLFDGTDAANARLKEFIKIALTYCEDCRERSGVLKAPYSQTQQGLYMPGSTTYNSDVLNVLNLGGAGNISLGGGGSLTGGSEGVDE